MAKGVFVTMARDFDIVPELLSEKQLFNIAAKILDANVQPEDDSDKFLSFSDYQAGLFRIALLCFGSSSKGRLSARDNRHTTDALLGHMGLPCEREVLRERLDGMKIKVSSDDHLSRTTGTSDETNEEKEITPPRQLVIDSDGNRSARGWVQVVVGGRNFGLPLESVLRYPKSRLARLLSLQPGSQQSFDSVYIDRNPTMFEPVLHFYRTGELCVPSTISLETARQEASFYEIESEMFGVNKSEATTPLSKLQKLHDLRDFRRFQSAEKHVLVADEGRVVFELRSNEHLLIDWVTLGNDHEESDRNCAFPPCALRMDAYVLPNHKARALGATVFDSAAHLGAQGTGPIALSMELPANYRYEFYTVSSTPMFSDPPENSTDLSAVPSLTVYFRVVFVFSDSDIYKTEPLSVPELDTLASRTPDISFSVTRTRASPTHNLPVVQHPDASYVPPHPSHSPIADVAATQSHPPHADVATRSDSQSGKSAGKNRVGAKVSAGRNREEARMSDPHSRHSIVYGGAATLAQPLHGVRYSDPSEYYGATPPQRMMSRHPPHTVQQPQMYG
eukprot:1014548_1